MIALNNKCESFTAEFPKMKIELYDVKTMISFLFQEQSDFSELFVWKLNERIERKKNNNLNIM